MIIMYYQKHISSPRIARCRRTIIVLAVLFIILSINAGIRSVVEGAVTTQARMVFNESLNNAINSSAGRYGDSYQFVILTRTSDGAVASLQTNSDEVNRFRAELGIELAENLEQYQYTGIKIPLGNLTGIDILFGRGPELELKLVQQGSILTDLSSSFSSAGINQTLHTVDCTASAKFYAMIPGYSIPVSLEANVMVSQSVIVGAVPDSYTNVNGDQNDTIGRIFDYGDPYGTDAEEHSEN